MRDTEFPRQIRQRYRLDQPVRCFTKFVAHAVYSLVDKRRSVYYIVNSRAKQQGWPLSRQEESTSLESRTDPKAARSPTIALLRGRGQEDGRPNDDSSAEQG